MTKKRRVFLWALWAVVLSPFLCLFSLIQLTSFGFFGPLPPLESYETIEQKNPEASQIISSDGVVLGTYFLSENNRISCKYEEISKNVIDALIATEDIRFREHSGIDARSLLRAITALGAKGGASTITQQLAKLHYTENPSERSDARIMQKAKEWVIAAQLEKRYTKNEILTMYLNKADWGNSGHGIRSASYVYFKKDPIDLNEKEAALLVGMLKAPSAYDPTDHYGAAFKRRNIVLSQMNKYNFISDSRFKDLKNDSIVLNFERASHDKGQALYFRQYIQQKLKRWCLNNKKSDGTNYNIYTDGLKIHTTIDSRMQLHAEEAVKEHLTDLQEKFNKHWYGYESAPFEDLSKKEINTLLDNYLESSSYGDSLKNAGLTKKQRFDMYDKEDTIRLFSWSGDIDSLITPRKAALYNKSIIRSGMMSMDPKTGHVKAYVGGINFKHYQYDHVSTGRRQVGSTFKPFLYATAIEHGRAQPCDKILNTPVTFSAEDWGLLEEYTPNKDTKSKYDDMEITMKEGLAKSLNHIAAFLMKELTTTQPVIDMARNMGITSNLSTGPSICLGPDDLSVFEMVGAYSTFVNEGLWIEPVFITQIVDKNGVVIENFVPKRKQAMSKETANIMLRLLQGVVDGGTGSRIKSKSYPWQLTKDIGGKTGTTQNHSDGWFMGVTPNLVTGVWTGCEDRAAHFRSLQYGQAASTALPIFAGFMKRLYDDSVNTKIVPDNFKIPKSIDKKFNCKEENDMEEFNEFE